ncbi:hypothetical protein Csa_013245 [Cucumis sativus]|uniref:Uncharacterized protein n=1 Tax=Cucumis sativus TaxID=3659 RepID=A0A0A0LRI0_CUCSA|nr:hypothetical protein Csa_013245 [Cucumis sativus]
MEGWGSKSVSVDVLIVKLEETVKKLKSVSGKTADLVISGSLLAWFFSACNQLEAWTNELLSTLNKLSLPNPTLSLFNGELISKNNLNSISKPPTSKDTEARGKKRSTSLDDTTQEEPKTKRS